MQNCISNLKIVYIHNVIVCIVHIPMAKKQSIPTIRNIFSISDGLELASMHLRWKKMKKEKKKSKQSSNKHAKNNEMEKN